MNLARQIAVAVALILALMISARMIVGPFALAGIPINVPLNIEGLFGLAITAALALRVSKASVTVAGQTSAAIVIAGSLAIVAISIFSLRSALNISFVSDDFIVIKMARDWTMANVSPLLTTAGGDGFFRPFGYLSLAFDGLWAGTNTTLWHASAIAIHTVNAVLVMFLARQIGISNLSALLAGSLFALHGSHPEAAVWIAGRFDLVATLFTLMGLILFLRFVAAGSRNSLYEAGGLVCATLALLSKEAAYVFPLVALVLALALPMTNGRVWRRTIPYFIVTGIAFLYRSYLLGGIGGYKVAENGQSAFLSLKLTTTAKVLFARLWTSLYFPINWSSEPPRWLAVAAVASIAALVWLAWSSRPGKLLWIALGCLGLSILPALHLLGGAADLSGGRLLYLPSVWFCIFIAAANDGLAAEPQKYLTILSLLIFQFSALQHNLAFWTNVGQRVKTACEIASHAGEPVNVSGLPRSILGVPAFANGFPECVELSAGHPIAVNFVRSPTLEMDATVLVWDDAKGLLRRDPVRPELNGNPR